MNPLILKIFRRISLTPKMLFLTVLIGMLLWGVLDRIQTKRLERIFDADLLQKLQKHHQEDRIQFDAYVAQYNRTVKLLVAQRSFQDYVTLHVRAAGRSKGIDFHTVLPSWLPDPSIMRRFAYLDYALLIDGKGEVREVYQDQPEAPPQSLLRPSGLIRQLSQNQSFMTSLDGVPFLLTSETYLGKNNRPLATLLLAARLDDDFLKRAHGEGATEYEIMALVGGEEPRVVASDRPELLPDGTKLNALTHDYIVVGKSFFDWGGSDLTLQLTTFMSKHEFSMINDAIVAEDRMQRAGVALSFIIVYALIVYWITRHIRRLTKSIADISINKLNMPFHAVEKGDELLILEDQFHHFTDEILESRERLKKQAEVLLREKTVYLDNVLHSSTLAITAADLDFRIKYFNAAAEKLFGFSAEAVVGKTVSEIHEGLTIDPDRLEKALTIARARGEYQNTFEHKKTGVSRFLEFKVSGISDHENVLIGYLLMAQDVTERKRVEEKMKLNAVVFSNTSEGIMITDKNARIQSVNKAFEQITGYSTEEAVGQNPRILQSGKHDAEFYKDIWSTLREQGQWKGVMWNKRKNGEIYPQESVLNVIRDKNQEIVQYVAVFSDITARMEAEETLRNLSNRDQLTGLANRRAFDAFFKEEWRRAQRNGTQLAVMMLDVDFFKKYNDAYGHLKGDECLQKIAGTLTKFVRRPGEIAARFGGEEFVVILSTAETLKNIRFAEKICKEIEALKIPHEYSEVNEYVTMSIGIATVAPSGKMSLTDAINCADKALYQAKHEGRNRVVFLDATVDTSCPV